MRPKLTLVESGSVIGNWGFESGLESVPVPGLLSIARGQVRGCQLGQGSRNARFIT